MNGKLPRVRLLRAPHSERLEPKTKRVSAWMDDMPRPFLICEAQLQAGILVGCRLMAYQRSGFVFMLACLGLSNTGNNVLKGADHGGSQDPKD